MTADDLRSVLDYCPDTGVFNWKVNIGRAKVGAEAGTLSHGYRRIDIAKRCYGAHRLAWPYVYGEWPERHVDHINRIPSDNRISNLRLVTHAENHQNRNLASNNTSGVKGVCWNKLHKKWYVYIKIGGKMKFLGLFRDIRDAAAARLEAEKVFHPFAAKLEQPDGYK